MTEMSNSWVRIFFNTIEENLHCGSTPAKSLLNAAVLTPNGTNLSETALETIRRMRYYMNETDGVVLYSDCVGVMVHTGGIDAMLEEAADCAGDVAGRMPDFSPYNMDDGGGLVCMQSSAFCFRPYGLGGALGPALEARQECLEACERQHPIAIVYNDAHDLP